MDTLTHALSGALLARASAGARPIEHNVMALGQRITVGTVAAAFPDIDFVLGFISPLAYLTGHRGVTHSILLLPLWAVLLGVLAGFAFKRRDLWRDYALVAALGLGAHILGDLITSFGTMVLSPLSSARFGWGTTFVIDLWFSAIIIAGLAMSAVWRASRLPAATATAVLVAYVGMQGLLKAQAAGIGEEYAQKIGLPLYTVETVPRPLSPFNWTVVVRNGHTYYLAHVNLMRRAPPPAAAADAGLIARLSASFQPAAAAAWHEQTLFGSTAAEAVLSRQAWEHPSFAFYRWFAELPALYDIEPSADGICVWFQDLRFLTPGRDFTPFRYGLCSNGSEWHPFELLAGGVKRLLE